MYTRKILSYSLLLHDIYIQYMYVCSSIQRVMSVGPSHISMCLAYRAVTMRTPIPLYAKSISADDDDMLTSIVHKYSSNITPTL